MAHVDDGVWRFAAWKSAVLPCVLALMGGLNVRAGVAQAALVQAGDLQSAGMRGALSSNFEASAILPVSLGFSNPSGANAPDASAASSGIMAVPTPHAKKAAQDRGRILFSRIAVASSAGTLGFGGQIATPLVRWANLRGGFDFLSFGYRFAQSGVNHTGSMQLRSGSVSLDLFPFRSGFHVSPGILIFKSSAGGSLSVPGGDTFSMGDATLTSNVANPVTGSEGLDFKHSIMPTLTIGFSNMIANKGRHWSVPLELGVAYTGQYSARIGLLGSVCYKGYCGSTNSAAVRASVMQQQNSLDETMKHYQVFPIVRSGVSYRF